MRDWEHCNCRKPTARRENLPLLQLEPIVFECQYLLPWEIGTLSSYARYFRLVQHIFLFVLTYTTFFSKSKSTLLVEQYLFFNPVYVGDGVPCFLVPTLPLHKVFVLACIAQHRLAELDCNKPMDRRTICLSYWCGVCHTMLCTNQNSSMHALPTLVLGQRIR